MSEQIEAVAEEVEATELVPTQQSGTLFRSDDPATVLQRAQATAEALLPVIREQGLVSKIEGREFLRVEAWQTLGAMLGVTPVCTWTRKLDDGWEARVEAQTLDGRVIGAAEAECLRGEANWKDSEDYAIRSMAQTRATSKALASVLRFVATLAGLEGTPAEEMDGVKRRGGRNGAPKGFASDKQRGFMERLLKEAGGNEQAVTEILSYCSETLTGERDGAISTWIDKLVEAKAEEDKKTVGAELLMEARAYLSQQSDVPVDETGLAA